MELPDKLRALIKQMSIDLTRLKSQRDAFRAEIAKIHANGQMVPPPAAFIPQDFEFATGASSSSSVVIHSTAEATVERGSATECLSSSTNDRALGGVLNADARWTSSSVTQSAVHDWVTKEFLDSQRKEELATERKEMKRLSQQPVFTTVETHQETDQINTVSSAVVAASSSSKAWWSLSRREVQQANIQKLKNVEFLDDLDNVSWIQGGLAAVAAVKRHEDAIFTYIGAFGPTEVEPGKPYEVVIRAFTRSQAPEAMTATSAGVHPSAVMIQAGQDLHIDLQLPPSFECSAVVPTEQQACCVRWNGKSAEYKFAIMAAREAPHQVYRACTLVQVNGASVANLQFRLSVGVGFTVSAATQRQMDAAGITSRHAKLLPARLYVQRQVLVLSYPEQCACKSVEEDQDLEDESVNVADFLAQLAKDRNDLQLDLGYPNKQDVGMASDRALQSADAETIKQTYHFFAFRMRSKVQLMLDCQRLDGVLEVSYPFLPNSYPKRVSSRNRRVWSSDFLPCGLLHCWCATPFAQVVCIRGDFVCQAEQNAVPKIIDEVQQEGACVLLLQALSTPRVAPVPFMQADQRRFCCAWPASEVCSTAWGSPMCHQHQECYTATIPRALCPGSCIDRVA